MQFIFASLDICVVLLFNFLQQQQYQITIAMQMIQNRSALRAGARSAGRARSVVVRADARPLWAPGVAAPAWLDGSLPGDRGECVFVCG